MIHWKSFSGAGHASPTSTSLMETRSDGESVAGSPTNTETPGAITGRLQFFSGCDVVGGKPTTEVDSTRKRLKHADFPPSAGEASGSSHGRGLWAKDHLGHIHCETDVIFGMSSY